MFGRSARLAMMIATSLTLASAPTLANPFIIETTPEQQFQSTFGLRYWYGIGNTSKNLYNAAGNVLISRLTYDRMQSHSLEIYGRIDHSGGLFAKGYAGGGLLNGGNLKDEDFPPLIAPYSSTNSTLRNQLLGYFNLDIGGGLIRGADFRVDGFVGYHYFHQRMKAFGCQQTATNAAICAGGIADSVAVIVEDDTWQSLRLGLNADIPLIDRIRLNIDAAWLPYVWMAGTDNHLLRPDLPSPIRQDGHGSGYQLEALVSYQYDKAISLGAGFRYWHMQSSGKAHFEDIGGNAQALDFKADVYGVFLQASYRFEPF